jgi:hypothetical protein
LHGGIALGNRLVLLGENSEPLNSTLCFINTVRQKMKRLSLFVAGISLLLLSGCIFPPMRLMRTPSVSGRIVDSTTRLPIAHAKVDFVEADGKTTFQGPSAVTDGAGHFDFARTSNYIGGGISFNPMAGDLHTLGDSSLSFWLRISGDGYVCKIVDVRGAYNTLRFGGKDIPKSSPEDIQRYNGTVLLGDILLIKQEKEPNQSPEATPDKRPPASPSSSSGAPQL